MLPEKQRTSANMCQSSVQNKCDRVRGHTIPTGTGQRVIRTIYTCGTTVYYYAMWYWSCTLTQIIEQLQYHQLSPTHIIPIDKREEASTTSNWKRSSRASRLILVFIVYLTAHFTPSADAIPDINLQSFTSGTSGFKIIGAATGHMGGYSVGYAGDVNRDGFSDVMVVSQARDVTHVIFGHSSSTTAFTDVDVQSFSQDALMGFSITVPTIGDQSGCAVHAAGDVNGDGNDDVIVGSPLASPDMRLEAGTVYIIFGHSKPFAYTEVELSVLSSTTGVAIVGAAAGNQMGSAVAGAGDVNGDGIGDVILGARYADSGAGSASGIVYVLFGAASLSDIDLQGFAAGSTGFRILGGAPNDECGTSVAGAGDVNADGYDDVIIGAPKVGNKGAAYIIFGHTAAFADVDLSTFRGGTSGFVVWGSHSASWLGSSVETAGDVNGDGYDDVIMGAYGPDSGTARAYVVFGHTSSEPFKAIDLTSPLGTTGFTIKGAARSDQAGHSVCGAGDLNGDGYADIMVGAHTTRGGVGYVIFGRSNLTVFVDVELANFVTSESTGFRIFGGAVSGGATWITVGSAGDVNGDGWNDIIIGTAGASPHNRTSAAVSFVIFGYPSSMSGIQAQMAQPSITKLIVAPAQLSRSPSLQELSTKRQSGKGGHAAVLMGDEPTSQPSQQPTSFPSAGPSYVPTSQPSSQPSTVPSMQPSRRPSSQPSSKPSNQPTQRPSTQPSTRPSAQPFSAPSGQPTSEPSMQPSRRPSSQPSSRPSTQPTSQPSSSPTCKSTSVPTVQPSRQPTRQPSTGPTSQPSMRPSSQPSVSPTAQPSRAPSGQPSAQPSSQPSQRPSSQPSATPTLQPSSCPSSQPSALPSSLPSVQPTMQPTLQPSRTPTTVPTSQPSMVPSVQPSSQPSCLPSGQPNCAPSSQPTAEPSSQPTVVPSRQPSMQPTLQPFALPTSTPSRQPSTQPSQRPSAQPSCRPSTQPSSRPSSIPSAQPSQGPTVHPSCQPSVQPSNQPSQLPSSQPSSQPTLRPSMQPTMQPSAQPSVHPTTLPSSQPSNPPSSQPSAWPSSQPSRAPSTQPSVQPSRQPFMSPTAIPTSQPSQEPSVQPSAQPSCQPTRNPSAQPTSVPSQQPFSAPSAQPSIAPSGQPSQQPSNQPSHAPTSQPTDHPSAQPSSQPSRFPSAQPSQQPTPQPSSQPSTQPSNQPSQRPSSQPSCQPSMQPTMQPTIHPSTQPSRHPSVQPSSWPSRQPSSKPSMQPSSQPSRVPSTQPSSQPSKQPFMAPTAIPTSQPSHQPSVQPSAQPSCQPTRNPSAQPTSVPSQQPFSAPSAQPSIAPSGQPSHQPSNQPSRVPSSQPTQQPTSRPSSQPSSRPSEQPTCQPSFQPSSRPTTQPSDQPSLQPSMAPSQQPTVVPSSQPTFFPTVQPSSRPTSQPSANPSNQPTGQPSSQPFMVPTSIPTTQPTRQPSGLPSRQPSSAPTSQPSDRPSSQPSDKPTTQPTILPSMQPSVRPSSQPSSSPTSTPTMQPSVQPSVQPSTEPSTLPTSRPSAQPSAQPSTQPSNSPSAVPSNQPSRQPSSVPSSSPTSLPSVQPSSQPSSQPFLTPTSSPTAIPTDQPTNQPSAFPSSIPTCQPSSQPSAFPTSQPTRQPSGQPTKQPTSHPSPQPSRQPSRQPTQQPSSRPSMQPTMQPTSHPTCQPSVQPSSQPSSLPSRQPTTQPSLQPSNSPSAQPSTRPSCQPSVQPSMQPTCKPTSQPSGRPSQQPSCQPSSQPTEQPSSIPSRQPSSQPTIQPSSMPTTRPTRQPSAQPSKSPSAQPSSRPSCQPSVQPSTQPTRQPSSQPSERPTQQPTCQPSSHPSTQPTSAPSIQPSSQPSVQPSSMPTARPSRQPSSQPSIVPSCQPTNQPSAQPVQLPTARPTTQPSQQPSRQPSSVPSGIPTAEPSTQPTSLPSSQPSSRPSTQPTDQPTQQPTSIPSSLPTTIPTTQPSVQPSNQPSVQPSMVPSCQPSSQPTQQPSSQPSSLPTTQPSSQPSTMPSCQPSTMPSSQPSNQPSSLPTCVPSSQPSSLPSFAPSAQPSTLPSSQPSVFPSVQPTEQPSSAPSAVPSADPSSQPTVEPSGEPSSQPSSQPSSGPSSQPSTTPQSMPTAVPSSQPSLQPFSLPTSVPSVQPSSLPTQQPSSIPSCQPSTQPSVLPTSVPSAQPSQQPSGSPTHDPTAQPSSSPTVRPSAQPSASPTKQPSARPSAIPSSGPSSQPSSAPTVTPSVQPTAQPTNEPSAQPTEQPSRQPSSRPSMQPIGAPSAQPSSIPAGRPSSIPSVSPSSQPSSQPYSAPTSQPSIAPSAQPSQQPSRQPSSQPTLQPSGQPSFAPTSYVNLTMNLVGVAASNITITSVLATKTAFNVQVAVHGRIGVFIYCAAYPSKNYQLMSSSEIRAKSHFALASQLDVNVSVPSLFPSTIYSVFCMSETVQGRVLPLPLIQQTQYVISTSCCKTLTVRLLVSSLYADAFQGNAIEVFVDALPSNSITLTVSFTRANQTLHGGASVATTTYPATLDLSNTSSVASTRFTVVAGSVGMHILNVTVSGASWDEYDVLFATGNTVSVLSTTTAPPVPVLTSAIFSNTGDTVLLSFDSPTNKGGFDGNVQCETLLAFVGSAYAVCQWTSATNLAIYPKFSTASATNVLAVGSNVTLAAGKIRAVCGSTQSSAECNSWSTMPSTTVKVLPPAHPTTPTVELAVPASVGGCGNLRVDVTGSVGAAGRPWSSVTFNVLTGFGASVAAKQLENYLTRNYSFSPPTTVPFEVFEKGFTYSIQATMCNFLGACGSAVRSVIALPSTAQLPSVSILGPSKRNVYRNAQLVLNSDAYTQSCTGDISYANLDTEWKLSAVTDTGSTLSPLKSLSQSPIVFKLDPYSLSVNTQYDLQLTVTSLISGLSSSTKVSISVLSGKLVGVMKGNSNVYAKVADKVVLDASGSYDDDVSGKFGVSAGLSFRWACVQTLPLFSTACPLVLPADFATATIFSEVEVSSLFTALNTTSQVSVTVFDATRSSIVSVDVTIIHGAPPVLSITSSTNLVNVNTGQKLALLGSLQLFEPCTAVWGLRASQVKLSDITRMPLTKHLTPDAAAIPFNLVILADALPQRSTLQFTLGCGKFQTEVTVTINGAPLPGEFTVSPSTGEELTTKFVFSAFQWVDADIPLTYQFGFMSPTSDANQVIMRRSELTFTTSVLPSRIGGRINCTVSVFDSMSASTQSSAFVAVSPMSSANQGQVLLAFLQSSTGSLDSAKSIISVASGAINAANCTAAPNCTFLQRSPCMKTSGQCGSCLPGYLGDIGDRNTQCVPAVPKAATGGSDCTAGGLCHSWQVCDSITRRCIAPAKSCESNCSSNGHCMFRSRITGVRIQKCTVEESNCESLCSCNPTFSGMVCEVSLSELRANRAVRSNLVSKLHNLTLLEDVNAQSVSAWSDNLYSVALNPFELSATDVTRVLDIANRTISSALSTRGIKADDILGVLQAVNAVASIRRDNYDANDYDAHTNNTAVHNIPSNTGVDTLQLVSSFADLLLKATVLGESASTYVYDNFRLSTELHPFADTQSDIKLISPQSDIEVAVDTPATTAKLVPSARKGKDRASSLVTEAATSTVSSKVVLVFPRAYTIDTSDFVSNPMHIEIHSDNGAVPSSYLSDMEFTFQHIEARPIYETYNSVNFTSTCDAFDESEQHTFVCPDSGHVLAHNCSQGPGVYTSYCPKPAPSCAHLETSSALITELQQCSVNNYTATHTMCVCSFAAAGDLRYDDTTAPVSTSPHLRGGTEPQWTEALLPNRGSTQQRKLLTTEQEFMDDSGVTDMVTTSTYIAADTKSTFEAADNLGSVEAVRRVFIVVLLIGCIWAAGLISFFAEFVRPNMPFGTPGAPPKTAKQRVLNYVDNIIPRVFAEDQVFTVRILNELLHHHSFFRMFAMESRRKRQETIFKFLSSFTFMIFLVAVFYDVGSPDDDGSCVNYTNQVDCLRRNSPFDHSQNYCKWGPSRHGNMECSFAKQQLSLKAMIYLSFLITVLTALMTIPNDYLYSLISSPTVESIKKTKLAHSRRKFVAQTLGAQSPSQRLSAVFPDPASEEELAVMKKADSMVSVFSPTHKAISASREIPDAVTKARALASLSLATVNKGAMMIVEQADSVQRNVKARTSLQGIGSHRRSNLPLSGKSPCSADWSDDDNLEGGIRGAFGTSESPPPSERRSVRFLGSTSDISAKDDSERIRKAADQICEDVICQRLIMRDDAEETVLFDQQWGIKKVAALHGNTTPYAVSAESYKSLLAEVQFSTTEAKQIDSDIMSYSENHAGVEMLHVFMLDMLGRNTPAAKIFREKFGEEFEGSRLVTKLQVYLSVITVVCLNLFFMFYLILKGYVKGPKWQYQFFWSCAAQVLVDIFIFETTECIWLNYSIPAVVHREVGEAAAVVREIVQRVTVTSHIQSNSPRRAAVFNGYFLNAPAHLFVSVKLAKAYPDLLESLIVTSYVHHLPGKLCYSWPHYREFKKKTDETMVSRDYPQEKFFFSGTVVAMVLLSMWFFQAAAAIPFSYQKIIIRSIQPIIFSVLALIWYLAFGNIFATVSVAAVSVLVALMIAKCHIDMYKMRQHQRNRIAPAPGDTESGKSTFILGPVPTVLETKSDDDDSGDSSSEDGATSKVAPLLEDRELSGEFESSAPESVCGSDGDASVAEKLELAVNKLAVGMVSELLNGYTSRRVAAASLASNLVSDILKPKAPQPSAVEVCAEELVATLISRCVADILSHHAPHVRGNARATAVERASKVVSGILHTCATELAANTAKTRRAAATQRVVAGILHACAADLVGKAAVAEVKQQAAVIVNDLLASLQGPTRRLSVGTDPAEIDILHELVVSAKNEPKQNAELLAHELFAPYNRPMRNAALFTNFSDSRNRMHAGTNDAADDVDDQFSVSSDSASSSSSSSASTRSVIRPTAHISQVKTPRSSSLGTHSGDSSSSSGVSEFDDDHVDIIDNNAADADDAGSEASGTSANATKIPAEIDIRSLDYEIFGKYTDEGLDKLRKVIAENPGEEYKSEPSLLEVHEQDLPLEHFEIEGEAWSSSESDTDSDGDALSSIASNVQDDFD